MPKTGKMVGRNEGAHGSDEPEVLLNSGLQPTSKPHRIEGKKKIQRGSGVVARERKIGDRPRERRAVPDGK